MHVTDLVPTFLDLAGAQASFRDRSRSSRRYAASRSPRCWPARPKSVRTDEDWIGEELFGNRMMRQGDWKLCYILKTAGGSGEWELFNLKHRSRRDDRPFQTRAGEDARHCSRSGMNMSTQNGVILTDDGPFAKSKP